MSNQQIVAGSPMRPVSSPAMSSWPDLQYEACVSSCAAGLKSKRKAVGCTYNLCAAIAPMGISWCTDGYCSSRSSQLGKLIEDWLPFPSPACIAPFCAEKAGQQGRSFPDSAHLISHVLCVPGVCGILSKMVLLSSSGGQQREIAAACIV